MVKVLVDYDNTLANTQHAMLTKVNEEFGTQYQEHDVTSWNTESIFPSSVAEYMWGYSCWYNEDMQASVKPMPGAIEGVLSLIERGHQPMIVSDRPAALFEVTRDWLDRYGLDMVRLLFTRHKHSMNTRGKEMTKLQAAVAYKLTEMIDDSPHHPPAFAVKPYIDRVFLLDAPYNQGVEGEKIMRVDSWNTIIKEYS